MPKDSRVGWSRREAIGLLGAGTGAGAGLVSLVMGETDLGALRQNNAAIIRTVLPELADRTVLNDLNRPLDEAHHAARSAQVHDGRRRGGVGGRDRA